MITTISSIQLLLSILSSLSLMKCTDHTSFTVLYMWIRLFNKCNSIPAKRGLLKCHIHGFHFKLFIFIRLVLSNGPVVNFNFDQFFMNDEKNNNSYNRETIRRMCIFKFPVAHFVYPNTLAKALFFLSLKRIAGLRRISSKV